MSHTSNPPLLAVHEIPKPKQEREQEMTTTTKDLCWGLRVMGAWLIDWTEKRAIERKEGYGEVRDAVAG